jgi:hypothetical protein
MVKRTISDLSFGLSSVPTLCEQNELVIGNRLNFGSLSRSVLVASRQSECARKVLENDIALEWLQQSWESSRQESLDLLPAKKIDAEHKERVAH